MINTRPNKNTTRKHGQALLVFIVVLLLSVTMLVLSLAKSGIFQQKITGNEYRSSQAFEAAQAGLAFGVVYLNNNQASIIISTGGYLNTYSSASTNNVALSNGSKYTVTYTNPTQNNFSLIQLNSVGTSADGTASSTVREQVYLTPMPFSSSSYPLFAEGNVSMAGNTTITNMAKNETVLAGGSVNFAGNSTTVLSSGTSSNSSHTLLDVSQNNASISSMSSAAFFTATFGASSTSVQNNVAYTYTNSSNTDYSTTLNGLTGTSIWINQTGGTTATIAGNTVIGSAAKPVILIVNGNFSIAGNAIIYGLVYVSGNSQSAGNVSLTGALVAGGNVTDAGNFNLTYNSSILSSLQLGTGNFSIVTGSWDDFQQ